MQYMEYSPSAWLGALAGMIVAAVLYGPAIRLLARSMGAPSRPLSLEQRAAREERNAVLRRLILGLGVAALAVLGYWIGKAIGAGGQARFN